MLQTESLLLDAPFPVATLDHDLNFTGFSTVWLETFKLKSSIKGLSFKKVLQLLPEEFYLDLQLCKEGIGRSSEPLQVKYENGTTDWFQWKMSPWQGSPGQPLGSVVILENVTEEVRSRDLYSRAQRMARVGGWVVDLIENTVYWSAITKEIHEVAPDFEPDLETGINFYKEGFSRDTITKLVTKAIEKGTPWDVELILVTIKGKELWVRAKGEAEFVDGKCIRLSGTFQDIDTRKRAELESRKLSERLEIATGAAHIGVWDFDIVNNILEWDENMYPLYGIEKSAFEGEYEAWEATVHPEDKEWSAQAVTDAITGKKDLNMDFRIYYKEREIHWIHAEATVIRNKKGEPLKMIGANWDVTNQKQAEEHMQSLLNTTTFQNESLLNFAHIVSHNMRSHATNLSMLTNFLLNDRIGKGERKNTLQMLHKAANGLNETIAHLNEVVQFKTEAEKKMVPIEANRIIDKVVSDLKAVLLANEIDIQLKMPSELKILGVPAYVESIILNLITNGLKYSDPNKHSIIEITSTSQSDRITLHFQDNGLGIDLDKHGSKLFGMYKTFHHHPESRGIGLFITRNQIESMQGSIAVESTPGEGSCFSITFKTP